MAEQDKYKRVKFPSGEQKEFIVKSKEELDLTWNELSKIAGTSTRNLTDWKNEKNSMSLFAVENICKERNCKFPVDIEILKPYWYVKKGAIAGGKAKYEKYGFVSNNEEKRKEKWQQWWEQKGRFDRNKILKPLPFRKPKFSKELAEFVGIMLGDGGMTKYQAKITLHCEDDLEYSCYVENLIAKLFEIRPSKKNRNNCAVLNIVLSRVDLVRFLVDKVKLRTGNKVKHQIDIPQWVKNERKFKIACLRGLIDTDGCIIIHKYASKGKIYSYKKLSFTSRSLPLLNSVRKILNELDIKNRITKNNFEIRVEAKRGIAKFFDVVGSHNPKHQMRYGK